MLRVTLDPIFRWLAAAALFCSLGSTPGSAAAPGSSTAIPCGDNAALIAAINLANLTEEQEDTIHLAPGCIYTFTNWNESDSSGFHALPVIQDDLKIYGHGATLRRSTDAGTPAFRFLMNAQGARLTIDYLTFENGGSPKFVQGGAISSAGTLNLTRCVFRNNYASIGGALDLSGSAMIQRSLFLNNTAVTNGGAIYAGKDTPFEQEGLIIANTTFTGNRAPFGFAIETGVATILRHATIAGNTPKDALNFESAAVWKRYDNSITLMNTILQNAPYDDCKGEMLNLGGNYASSAACGDDISSGDAGLGLLADNGGPTETLALPETSPAAGIGIPENCLETDQRGKARDPWGGCDAGAYEHGGMITGGITVLPNIVGAGEPVLAVVTLQNGTGEPLTAMALSSDLPEGVVLTNLPAAISTCGLGISGTEGSNTVNFSNGNLAAAESCMVQFYLRGEAPGQYVLPSGTVSVFSPPFFNADLFRETGLLIRGNTRLVYEPHFIQTFVNRPVKVSARVETIPYLHNLPRGEVIYEISGPGPTDPVQGKVPIENGYAHITVQGSIPGYYLLSASYSGSDWYSPSPTAQIFIKVLQPVYIPAVWR